MHPHVKGDDRLKLDDSIGGMYNAGVLVENGDAGSAYFRKRMGYRNPDSRATAAALFVQSRGDQGSWFAHGRDRKPLLAGLQNGEAPGQEIETRIYQARAMNPPWPPAPSHRADMMHPHWQTEMNQMGGAPGDIEMLAGKYDHVLPIANDSLEQISANALDENARKARNDPLSNTYAMRAMGVDEKLAVEHAERHSELRRIHNEEIYSQSLGKGGTSRAEYEAKAAERSRQVKEFYQAKFPDPQFRFDVSKGLALTRDDHMSMKRKAQRHNSDHILGAKGNTGSLEPRTPAHGITQPRERQNRADPHGGGFSASTEVATTDGVNPKKHRSEGHKPKSGESGSNIVDTPTGTVRSQLFPEGSAAAPISSHTGKDKTPDTTPGSTVGKRVKTRRLYRKGQRIVSPSKSKQG